MKKFDFSFLKRSQPKQPARMGSVIQSRTVLPEHARILRDVNQRIMRMYDAAVTNNLNGDFPLSVTSANAEILTSISMARSRARRLERDNPYAKAIVESFEDNVGGDDPFRLEMHVGKRNADGEFIEERDTNEMIEEAWEEAGLPENCTTRRDMSRLEMDLQTIAAVIRDGGILHRKWRGYPKNKFSFAIEPIEVDRLDHFWNRPAVGTGNEIQFSIEMDEWHAPIAYHILTRHPGDVFAYSNSPKYRERIAADDIIAIWDIRTRAGQYISVPRFASIIQRLHRIDQFDIAHVTAAIWASCKPFFIKQNFPTANEYIPDVIRNAMESAEGGSVAGDKISTTEPATGEILPYGQEPVLVDPKFPIETAPEFKKDNLRAACAGAGTAYHMIANDLEAVNFSSGRLGMQQFQDNCKKLQRHLILNYRRPHFNEWLKYAILSGRIKLPLSRLEELQKAARFYGRRWPYVNPLQDAQADVLRINAGLTSRTRVIAESDRGGDAEEVNAEIASDRNSDEAHGLDFSTPQDTTKPGVVASEETGTPSKQGSKQTLRSYRNGFSLNGHH